MTDEQSRGTIGGNSMAHRESNRRSPAKNRTGRTVMRHHEKKLLSRQLSQATAQEAALHVIGRERERAAICLGGFR